MGICLALEAGTPGLRRIADALNLLTPVPPPTGSAPAPVPATVNCAGANGRGGWVHRATQQHPDELPLTPICPTGAKTAQLGSVQFHSTDRAVNCPNCLASLAGDPPT
jgi:hypothetical protein